MSQLKTTAKQIEGLLADVYAKQAGPFVFDLAMAMLQGRDLEAALATAAAEIHSDVGRRQVELVFEEAAALLSVRRHTDFLAHMADEEDLNQILLRLKCGKGRTPISPRMIDRQQHPRKTMQSPIIAIPGVQIAQSWLSPVMIRTLYEFIENPDWACGIVELKSQQQIAITRASAKMILQGDFDRLMNAGAEHIIQERLADATRLKREDYFHKLDLKEFIRITRQELEPNNPDSRRELTWRGQARDGSWVQYTHEYRLIQDNLGLVYHVGRNRGAEPIPEPAPIA